MPLNTQVKRNGELRHDLVWDETTLDCFLTVGLIEGDPDLHYSADKRFRDLGPNQFVRVSWSGVYYIDTQAPLWLIGRQIVTRDHVFDLGSRRIEFLAGDELSMWRSQK